MAETIREQFADALSDTGGSSTGSSGSSGGGSTSSSSSGGTSAPSAPSGPSQAEVQAMRNLAASFQAIVVGLRIPVDAQIKTLIGRAVQGGMNSAAFMQTLRQTKTYAKRFPGIMKANGTMRMTESQYVSGYQQARDTARALGRGFSEQAYGLALKNGNSPSEIRMKLEAIDKLKSYGPLYQQFNDYLQATGLERKPLARKDLLTFIMGKGKKEWNDAYNTALVATQLEGKGFDVGKPSSGADVGYKGLAKIAKEIEVMGSSGDFSGVLAQADKVLNEGDFRSAGITRKDRVKLALGAKGAEESAARITQAVNVRVAALTEGSGNQLAQGPRGSQLLTGKRPSQAAE
jgi:hypothetical protein